MSLYIIGPAAAGSAGPVPPPLLATTHITITVSILLSICSLQFPI